MSCGLPHSGETIDSAKFITAGSGCEGGFERLLMSEIEVAGGLGEEGGEGGVWGGAVGEGFGGEILDLGPRGRGGLLAGEGGMGKGEVVEDAGGVGAPGLIAGHGEFAEGFESDLEVVNGGGEVVELEFDVAELHVGIVAFDGGCLVRGADGDELIAEFDDAEEGRARGGELVGVDEDLAAAGMGEGEDGEGFGGVGMGSEGFRGVVDDLPISGEGGRVVLEFRLNAGKAEIGAGEGDAGVGAHGVGFPELFGELDAMVGGGESFGEASGSAVAEDGGLGGEDLNEAEGVGLVVGMGAAELLGEFEGFGDEDGGMRTVIVVATLEGRHEDAGVVGEEHEALGAGFLGGLDVGGEGVEDLEGFVDDGEAGGGPGDDGVAGAGAQ